MKFEIKFDYEWIKKPIGIIEVACLIVELACLICVAVGGVVYDPLVVELSKKKVPLTHSMHFQLITHGAWFFMLTMRIISYMFDGSFGKRAIEGATMGAIGFVFHITVAILVFVFEHISYFPANLARAILALFIGLGLAGDVFFNLKAGGLV